MGDTKILVKNLNLFYGENHALKDVSMEIKEKAHGFHWTIRMWEIYFPEDAKQNE